jgi:hypothetical protein
LLRLDCQFGEVIERVFADGEQLEQPPDFGLDILCRNRAVRAAALDALFVLVTPLAARVS